MVLLRLLKENLGDREDIARVVDWDLDHQPYYIESEYTEGGDLKTWAKNQGGLGNVPLKTRLDLVAQTADALNAARQEVLSPVTSSGVFSGLAQAPFLKPAPKGIKGDGLNIVLSFEIIE